MNFKTRITLGLFVTAAGLILATGRTRTMAPPKAPDAAEIRRHAEELTRHMTDMNPEEAERLRRQLWVAEGLPDPEAFAKESRARWEAGLRRMRETEAFLRKVLPAAQNPNAR